MFVPRLLKICLICLGVLVLTQIVGFAWLFYDSRGLPDPQSLAPFAPATASLISDPCTKIESVAIPYESIGANLRAALSTAEAGEDDPGILISEFRSFTHHEDRHGATLSWRISQTMFCVPSKPLTRHLEEFRTAVQMERHFSRREMFTIFSNRVFFGKGIIGVEQASRRFYQKEPNQLAIGEAALIAGLASAPSYFSPIIHPDRALARRNEVLDAMVAARATSKEDALTAKGTPLRLLAD